ncbi:MAG TPA: exonuclease SbcCD subunit D [Candidatus Binatus sp.]|nr:exonuclease SbcCD subunit D [Candidatus Binatus sp.]
MTVQVLLTADNHLDPSAVQFGPKRFERKRDFQRCFEVLVNFAIENRPDLILVGGDLYDTILPGNSARAFVTDQFKRLYDRDIKIVLVSGHHDTPKSVEQAVSPLAVHSRSGHVYFLQGPQIANKKFVLDGQSVNIAGLSLDPNLSPDQSPLSGQNPNHGGDVNIFLTHYPIQGFEGYFGKETHISESSIPNGFQLFATGHLHKHQEKIIGDTPIIYPGSTERCSFHEEKEEKGFVWLELSHDGLLTEEFHPTPARLMETLDFEIRREGNLTRQIEAAIERVSDPAEKILRVRIKGNVSLEQLSTYKRSSLLDSTGTRFFYSEFDEEALNLSTQPALEAMQNTTPLQELDRTFQNLLSNAKEEQRPIVHEAWKLTVSKLQDAGVA